jgi:hypothetical protein
MGAVAVQESESLNDSFGFERDLWQRKTGQSSHVPKTSVFGTCVQMETSFTTPLLANGPPEWATRSWEEEDNSDQLI